MSEAPKKMIEWDSKYPPFVKKCGHWYHKGISCSNKGFLVDSSKVSEADRKLFREYNKAEVSASTREVNTSVNKTSYASKHKIIYLDKIIGSESSDTSKSIPSTSNQKVHGTAGSSAKAHAVTKKSKVDGKKAGSGNVIRKSELDKNYLQKFEKRCKHRYEIFDKALEEAEKLEEEHLKSLKSKVIGKIVELDLTGEEFKVRPNFEYFDVDDLHYFCEKNKVYALNFFDFFMTNDKRTPRFYKNGKCAYCTAHDKQSHVLDCPFMRCNCAECYVIDNLDILELPNGIA